MNYVIATSRPWHEAMAERLWKRCGHPFYLITKRKELTIDLLSQLEPRYVFFPHWSCVIPDEIYERTECVIFHMTDLPYGRGGSPLQNLIARGHTETMLTALRCVAEVDGGPIYMKRPLSLHGSAEEIYLRAGKMTEDMIVEIIQNTPEPVAQGRDAVCFRRRRPEESDISESADLDQLFDHIRMLDADGYPRAFLQSGRFRIEFSRAARKQDGIVADVVITQVDHE